MKLSQNQGFRSTPSITYNYCYSFCCRQSIPCYILPCYPGMTDKVIFWVQVKGQGHSDAKLSKKYGFRTTPATVLAAGSPYLAIIVVLPYYPRMTVKVIFWVKIKGQGHSDAKLKSKIGFPLNSFYSFGYRQSIPCYILSYYPGMTDNVIFLCRSNIKVILT